MGLKPDASRLRSFTTTALRCSAMGVTVPMKDEQGNVCELCGYLIDQDAHKQLYVGEELLDTTEREDVRVSEIASNDRIMHQKALADKNVSGPEA